MPADWAQLTHDNIMAAENERMASIQLRGLIEDVLTDVGNDQREQANTVDKAFAARVEEMHDAKRKLEDHLLKVRALDHIYWSPYSKKYLWFQTAIQLFDLFCFAPPSVFFTPPVTNYVLLYSTLLCKKRSRAPVGA